MSLQGKTALVTGAGSGIGRATALALAGQGVAVAVNDVDLERAQVTAKEVSSRGVRAVAARADVSSPDEVTAMIDEARKELNQIDILVNNAGIEHVVPFAQMAYEDWRRMLGIHVDGAFNCARGVVEGMVAARWGRIVNMASVAAFMGPDLQVHYATAKAALVGFTKSLAREVAPFGVTVNAIAPGLIDTPMARSFSPRFVDKMLELTPVGRLGQPEDIAYTALFLVAEEASFITGQVISPNGGHWV
ncbi:MAG: SDR family NAD(P)-dependent oxidoreductase [Dehalococcoidia bacterium]|jgi:3-oxoacyl-[acyl-carrier protein] reductase|nr:SDR family NAD(P)-dependent oxidoreductase [Dehalococcoidia bacterium]MDP7470227.1 SDR family NAD(P)-dependent oxidoreductase [Dehalococcoidia bacterium]